MEATIPNKGKLNSRPRIVIGMAIAFRVGKKKLRYPAAARENKDVHTT